MANKIIAIIPARGGSKRVPRKNILDFAGKPMIAWTIEAAKATGIFDAIIVSTDDQEIAAVSREFGAEVPFLRTDKADDHAPVSEATIHTLKQLETSGRSFDIVVQLFSVCPLRNAADILHAYQFFQQQKASFQISCFKYGFMNPWWAIRKNADHQGDWLFKDTLKRSQDLPELFCPTGAIWIAAVHDLLESNTFYGPGHIYCEIDWKRAVDIDSYEDIEFATALKTLNP